MKRVQLTLSTATLLAVLAATPIAQADWVPPAGNHADRIAHRHARGMSWHKDYYHTAWGAPISLVVPPTAHMQTHWTWGVSQNTMTPIYHQYRRTLLPGRGPGSNPLMPTPYWPSHTDQFGVYYVRGPY